MDNVISARTVTCFPNNKPWITRDFLNVKNRKPSGQGAGRSSKLFKENSGLRSNRRKMEARLQENNTREVCRGMRSITGYNEPNGQTWEVGLMS